MKLFALVLLLPTMAFADVYPWSSADIKREVAYDVLLAVDCAQTRDLVHQPEWKGYHEMTSRWALGTHPSTGRVNSYCLLSGLAHAGVKTLLPESWRPAFDYVTIGFEAGIGYRNYQIGLGMRW